MADVVVGKDKCGEQRLVSLPLSRIRVIMKSSPEVSSINQEALVLTAKATVRRAVRGGVEERGTAVGAARNRRAPPRPLGPASCRVHFGPLRCRPFSFEGRLTPLSHRARPSSRARPSPRPPVPLPPSFARPAALSFLSRPPSRARPPALSAPALLRALVATPVPFPPSLARGRSGLRRIGDF